MIEIIYKEEQKKADGNESFFKIPNNIRQIGEIKSCQKIYIEDYAYTFLKKISRNPEEGGKAAILFGKYHWSEGNSYLFIKSALQIQEMEVSQEHVVFTDKVWGQVYEDSKKYFPEQEIVGWFVSLPGFNMQINEVLLKTHLNHFAGNDKTLLVMEPGEWEEAFFLYENNQLIRQSGYYIYYEKNDAMQAYMIEMSQNKSIEETERIPDRAVVDFRKAVKAKGEAEQDAKQEKKSHPGNWLVGTCAAAAILAVGITFFNSYQNMQGTIGALIPGAKTEQEEDVRQVSAKNIQTKLPDQEKETAQEISSVKNDREKETGNQQTAQAEEGEEKQTDKDAEEQPDHQDDLQKGQAEGELSGEEAAETSGETVPGPNSGSKVQEYVIQKGDTLTSICKNKYGTITRLDEICRLNGISSGDIIYAGEKIMLPD